MAFDGHICCWHMYGDSMENKECGLTFLLVICKVIWGIYRLQLKVQGNMHVQGGRHICLGVYANNMICMYTDVSGHIVDCSDFI